MLLLVLLQVQLLVLLLVLLWLLVLTSLLQLPGHIIHWTANGSLFLDSPRKHWPHSAQGNQFVFYPKVCVTLTSTAMPRVTLA